MGRKKQALSEGKQNIIAGLLEEYDIQSAEDIQAALADLLGGTIKSMMEAEMDDHLGYERYEQSDNPNSRNGYKSKKVRSSYGEFNVEVPQDRDNSFDPKIVSKRQKNISHIDEKIIAMYARGLSTRQISDQIEDIYPIVFIDAVHFSVRKDKSVKKLAAYVVLGTTMDGLKEVLGFYVGENESSKYWLVVTFSYCSPCIRAKYFE